MVIVLVVGLDLFVFFVVMLIWVCLWLRLSLFVAWFRVAFVDVLMLVAGVVFNSVVHYYLILFVFGCCS